MSNESNESHESNENKRKAEASTADPRDRDLLTVEQAAGYLQLSTSSIRSYIRQGRLKAFRIAGLRKVLIPRAELLALLEPTSFVESKVPVPKLS